MTFDEFKYHYWDVLIKYISAYYPLSHSIIEQFKFDLDWRSISSNSEIEWTSKFIEDNKNNLVWHLLVGNPSIPLTVEFILQNKKRIDWDYLAHNPSLPLTDTFINVCGKHLKVAETNPNITSSFIEEHPDKLVTRQQTPPRPEGLDDCSLNNFNANWKNWKHNLYPEIYKRIIEPNLPGVSLVNLLKDTIPQPGKYVYFSPARLDELGLITSFEPSPKNAIDLAVKGNRFTRIEFCQSSLQEGKDRIYDFVRISIQGYPCLLVSKSALEHIRNFNLPEFRILQVDLKAKKVKINQEFFLIIFDDNTLIEECEQQQEFEFYFKRFSESGPKKVIKGENKSFSELKSEVQSTYAESISDMLEIYPKRVEIQSNLDLFTLNRKIIVSTRLRESIINTGFGPIDFQSTIPMVLTSVVNLESISAPQKDSTNHVTIVEDDFYSLKMKRLEEADPPFSRVDLGEDRLARVERKLNVIFPKKFRNYYLITHIIFDDGMMIEEFDWLPFEKFFIENSYTERYPESYKCCVVAENGGGDYIGLLLEKHDDYKLNEELVALMHETGEILKGKIQITLDTGNGG